jgi:hypothetical protein
MRIIIDVPAELACHSQEANNLVVTPEFSSSKGQCVFLAVEVENDAGEKLEEFTLVVSGADGAVRKKARVVAKALADMTELERLALRNGTNEDD